MAGITYGPAYYKGEIENDASGYLGSNPGWPIYNATWAVAPPPNDILFNYEITYLKGACVLHMLRYTIGDSLFFASLKSYAMDPAYKYKTAVTPEFVAKVNQVSGLDLAWFFDEWIYQPNHPAYQNTYSITGSIAPAAWDVDFTVQQVQATPSFFKMPIELKISFQTGADTLIRAMNDSNSQSFRFTFSRTPTSLQFDPNNNIVLKTASTVKVNGVSENSPRLPTFP